jgi:hypothetical protein
MTRYFHTPTVIPGRRRATAIADTHALAARTTGRRPEHHFLADVPDASTATPAGTLRSDPDTPGGAMSEQDDFPERFHRDRREHGGASQYIDNDQDEQLARLTEEERVAAGLDAYDPDEVPPATDTPPQPEDITQNEDWQEERAEFRREEDKGELGHINEHHPFPPTRYE